NIAINEELWVVIVLPVRLVEVVDGVGWAFAPAPGAVDAAGLVDCVRHRLAPTRAVGPARLCFRLARSRPYRSGPFAAPSRCLSRTPAGPLSRAPCAMVVSETASRASSRPGRRA